MRAEPIVELDQSKIGKLSAEHKQELVARCPRKVFKYDELKKAVDVENAGACILCNECVKYLNVDVDPNNNKQYNPEQKENFDRMIKVDERTDKFIFTVESTGSLSPEDIVIKAFSVLRTKLQNF